MAETEPKVVVGEHKSRLRTLIKSKKFWAIAAIALVLTAFIVISTLIILSNHKTQQNRAAAESKLAGESLQDKVNTGLANSKPDETLAMLAAQPNNDSKEILGYEALAYMSKPDYNKALEVWDELDSKYGMNDSEAAAAGYAAEQTNQIDRAIGYYQKAIDIANEDIESGTNQVDAGRYQKSIDELKAKK